MSNIAEVIGWKFPSQEGMICKEIDGVLVIVEFPGGIPTQANQDQWSAEFDAWMAIQSARVVTDETEQNVCKIDATILALINQTRAEWATWAGANFPTLTVAERNRMGVICWMLAVAIRRVMRT